VAALSEKYMGCVAWLGATMVVMGLESTPSSSCASMDKTPYKNKIKRLE
jgi:hypothetical protein